MHGNVRLPYPVKVVDKKPVEIINLKESHMKPMIKAGMISALTGLGAVAMLAPAYAAGFAELDANSDGQLDMTELQAAFDVHAEATLEAYDTDGDGMISVEEAEAMAAGSAAASAEGAAEATAEGAAEGAANAAEGLEQAGEVASDAAETGMSTATEATDGAAEAVGNALPATGGAEIGAEAGASVEAGTEPAN
ncbi:EF hand [Paracoccus saliphilus]|uniref:EF hand n=2 Tax=Paracoccus saliphilus TaxID=405559 RepID=A0AA45W261_9RHOB|nr:EF-hand domain-containing protein [Paracoccus saliphilus]SIS64091.1 EF hand [Paracoccus saliphilus]